MPIITEMEGTSPVHVVTIGDLLLGGADHHDALHAGERSHTRADLRALVEERRSELDIPGRRVVVLAGRPSSAWIVTYLALLVDGHVPLLTGDRRLAIEDRWQPAAVIDMDRAGAAIDRRPDALDVELHPDLALLLSTSGSSGSPKLVRLSHGNLVSNALTIATVLDLRPTDVGITSLPLHYCYGLSVLHAHLASHASVVAIDASVVDPCFTAALARHQVTNLAGVPHTFDLLEAAGAERVHVPSLRLLTQAGGRLHPEARERWRSRARGWGAEFLVMYGQTEATARIAYLPSELAETVGPDAIGRPIPGGSLDIRPVTGATDGIGELVYRGPNVMLGYATEPADLSLGATVEELETGDLGRFDATGGVFELVGRRSRIVKPFGLRISLDELEDALVADLGEVALTGDDTGLAIAAPGRDPAAVASLVAIRAGLPVNAVSVAPLDEIPRTSSQKVDHAAVLAAARADDSAQPQASRPPGDRLPSSILADVLGRATIPSEQSFVAAGGDSLSYVEATTRLEPVLGHLPDDWHHIPVGDLDRREPTGTRHRLDVTVLLRAVGICTVVATHMSLAYFPGGAHLLLAVAGYNLSRFQLGLEHGRDRLHAAVRTTVRVAAPAAIVAALVMATTDRYGWTTVALVNNYLGPRSHDLGHWHFWFIEAFVQLVAVTSLVLAIPLVRRLDLRLPYLVPLAALVGALALRDVTWAGLDDPVNLRFRTHGVAVFFVLGWLAHRSRTPLQRLATTACCIAVVPGLFGRPQREWYIVGGLLLLTWLSTVPAPRRIIPPVAVVASASMWILVTHFHVWPVADRYLPVGPAYAATLLAGIASAVLVGRAASQWKTGSTRARSRYHSRGLTPDPRHRGPRMRTLASAHR